MYRTDPDDSVNGNQNPYVVSTQTEEITSKSNDYFISVLHKLKHFFLSKTTGCAQRED